ncbi:MAG: MotA/TolQ/ExbB proton channel family protein [Rhodospirillaceae bacterium]|jgi:biopolymer transport protein ExbB|nr:MotA/TolQ/ExbB proton channel family protein [Rhodospirillaceae bacterium]MBT5564683.1 MotA/TolQ/ExbB proton channel family protein [Rhodospirillaceae bacterium]MBT6091018.1 MotA/TolQ/ExbB proton channel family protein [Rhodospirillaceae bacterium]
MNRFNKTLTAAVLVAAGLATSAPVTWAQESAPATSLQELLNRVSQGRATDNKANEERVREFTRAKASQQRLLDEAKAAVVREERMSEELEATFQENEIRLAELEAVLEERLGAFGELFGVVRQVAGDTRGQLRQSLISSQMPDREDAIDELAQSTELPQLAQLEKLWYTLLEEAAAQGQVVRFQAPVVSVDGKEANATVVRIGPFTAISDGKFVDYLPETQRLTELARQPGAMFVNAGEDTYDATSGVVTAAVDPSRGALLGLLVQTPSLQERIDQGGLVGYVIITLLVLGITLALVRIVSLSLTGSKVSAQKKSRAANTDNPLGRIMQTYEQNSGMDVENLQLKLDDAILKELPNLERGLSTIKVLAAISPMLGLLGTVTGMIETFQAITLFGTGDPKMMAGGISQALITTVLGLVAAIPLILLHSIASGRSKAVIEVLEEQSAGIIASHAERA